MSRYFTTSGARLAKKVEAVSNKVYFGRPSNNLSVGLVGLANVGKSTFFQAITKLKLGNPANYPFATIEPSKSQIVVELERLDHYQRIFASQKKIPPMLTIYDIAGLTRNASAGQGLGNKFLADIRQVDGILQVVRAFRDDDIVHIEDNKVDPVRDLVIVNDELILKDLEYVEQGLDKVSVRLKKSRAAEFVEEHDTLAKVQLLLYEGRKVTAYAGEWTAREVDIINSYNLLTAKPTVYLVNVNEADYMRQDNEYWAEIGRWIDENCPGDGMAMFCGEYEQRIADGDIPARPSALGPIIATLKQALHLISFYTCGPQEARQWNLRDGLFAPSAAGVIHTDLQKTFVLCVVYKWQDLGSVDVFDEAKMKLSGKQHKQGKKYVVEDGDVLIVKAAGGNKR